MKVVEKLAVPFGVPAGQLID
ncbi:hypothetical protein [Rhizorhabdus wittichii]